MTETSTSPTKRIIMLDASALKISSCRRRLYFTIVEGYRSNLNGQAMEFGSAFHLCPKGLEEHGNIGRATQESLKYWRECKYIPDPKKKYLDAFMLGKVCLNWYTGHYMQDSFSVVRDINNTEEVCPECRAEAQAVVSCTTCANYGYILWPTGKPMVEIKFAIPYYEDEHVIIMLSGTMDKVVEHRTSRLLAIGDYKTTAMWNEEEYLAMYELNCQLYVYTLALQRMVEACDVNSVLAKHKGKQIGAFIDGIFLKGADKDTTFKRSEVFIFKQSDMESFQSMLDDVCITISKMIEISSDEPGSWPIREGLINDSCSTKFGSCQFANVCKAPDSIAANHVLKRNFIQKPYNPMHFS